MFARKKKIHKTYLLRLTINKNSSLLELQIQITAPQTVSHGIAYPAMAKAGIMLYIIYTYRICFHIAPIFPDPNDINLVMGLCGKKKKKLTIIISAVSEHLSTTIC